MIDLNILFDSILITLFIAVVVGIIFSWETRRQTESWEDNTYEERLENKYKGEIC